MKQEHFKEQSLQNLRGSNQSLFFWEKRKKDEVEEKSGRVIGWTLNFRKGVLDKWDESE